MAVVVTDTWARYKMDTVCKPYLVVNNLSEVFNRMILDVRNNPVRTMLEGIRTKLMIKFQKIREKTEGCRWKITPTYSEILEEGKKWAKYCEAYMAGPGIWQVTSSSKNRGRNIITRCMRPMVRTWHREYYVLICFTIHGFLEESRNIVFRVYLHFLHCSNGMTTGDSCHVPPPTVTGLIVQINTICVF
mgnify:CR=1 FL=1